jgi:hypothetical protein
MTKARPQLLHPRMLLDGAGTPHACGLAEEGLALVSVAEHSQGLFQPVHRSMRGGGRGTAGGGAWRGHAGGGGWRLLSSALMRGDGSQKNRSSRLAWRSSLASLSVAIECFEALPVRTLVDLIYFST